MSKLPNVGNAAFCGVSVGPMRALEGNLDDIEMTSNKHKLTSGEHSTGRVEVLKQVAWPHHLLDAVHCQKPPTYNNLSQAQFAAGFSAKVLSEMPPEFGRTSVENQMKHFNRLMVLATSMPWESVLTFNAAFFRALEQNTVDWSSWDRIQAWHDRHITSLKMRQASGPDSTNPSKKQDTRSMDDRRMLEGVPYSFMKEQMICIKFQSQVCDHPGPHQLATAPGITVVHICAVCMFNKKGSNPDHCSKTCPNKQSFQPGDGCGGATS